MAKILIFGLIGGWTEKPLGLHDNIVIPDEFNQAKDSDFILPTQSWDINKLQAFLSDSIIQEISHHDHKRGGRERQAWLAGKFLSTFSVLFAYNILTGEQDAADDYEWIWKLKYVERLKTTSKKWWTWLLRLCMEADSIIRKKAIYKGGRAEWISWSPQEEGWVKLNTDGERKSNTRLASAGP